MRSFTCNSFALVRSGN